MSGEGPVLDDPSAHRLLCVMNEPVTLSHVLNRAHPRGRIGFDDHESKRLVRNHVGGVSTCNGSTQGD